MIKHPKVSVIIATYNRAHLISRAIESVLNQTFQDFEIIVVDDASTDNTKEVIKGFTDSRINYVCHANNLGVSLARNTGIKTCRGKYIAFLDSDDEWLPGKLDMQIKVLQSESSKVGVVFSDLLWIDENGKNLNKIINPKKGGYIYEDLLSKNCVGPPSTFLIKKECFNRVGYFDNLLNAQEDWDMWIRIAKYYRFSFIKIPLIKYRKHANQISKNLEAKTITANRILEKYSKELRKRPWVHSKHYFYIGNRFCHIGKTKEGQRYLLKAIILYPFCIRYYICLLGSLFGPKCFLYFINIKKYFINIIKNIFLKF